jgi:surface antigen
VKSLRRTTAITLAGAAVAAVAVPGIANASLGCGDPASTCDGPPPSVIQPAVDGNLPALVGALNPIDPVAPATPFIPPAPVVQPAPVVPPDPITPSPNFPTDPVVPTGPVSQPTPVVPGNTPAPTPAPQPEICAIDTGARIAEGNAGSSEIQLQIGLSQASKHAIQVDWLDPGNGGGGDYRADGGHLVFAPGVTRKTITVTVFGDTVPEPDESFTLGLRSPVGARVCQSPELSFVIVNDDLAPAPVPSGSTTAGGPQAPPAGTSDGPAGATGATHATGRQQGRFEIGLASTRLTHSGRLRLSVNCPAPGPRCAGTLGLWTGSRLAGRGRFSLPAGVSQVVHVALSRWTQKRLGAQPILIALDGGVFVSRKRSWAFRVLASSLRPGSWKRIVLMPKGNHDTAIGTMVGRGECTDWALNRRPDLKSTVEGDAGTWTADAVAAGLPVSKTPHEGDVMVMQGGAGDPNNSLGQADAKTGHVAYVESVNYDANGNPVSFVVSEQNWNGNQSSSTRTIQVSDLPPEGVDFSG